MNNAFDELRKRNTQTTIVGRLIVGVGLVLAGVAQADHPVGIETLATFNVPDLPEGIAVDKRGNAYLSMTFTGEIRRVAADGSQSTVTFIPRGPNGTGFLGGILGGMTLDRRDRLYVSAATFDPTTHGLWRVDTDTGAATRVAAIPPIGVPNGLHIDQKSSNLYITDSLAGLIWRFSRKGVLDVWLAHPLLAGQPGFPSVGVNGIDGDDEGNLVVANTDMGRLMRIAVNRDGSPGAITLLQEDPSLIGADDLKLDRQGNMVVALNAQNRVVRVSPAGEVTQLADVSNGLDFPASLQFGHGKYKRSVYLANFAVLSFLFGGTPHPSLMRINTEDRCPEPDDDEEDDE